jgi:hypothetical protein
MTTNTEVIPTLDKFKPILAEKLKVGKDVTGLHFRNDKGSVGTIIAGLGPHGKLRASMTCIEGGPDHIRERSDWHQCAVSPEKSKSRKPTGLGKSLQTADGVRFRLQVVLPTDTAEVVLAKNANNLAFEQAKVARDAAAIKAKEEKAAARKAAKEAKRVERQAAKDAERAQVLKTSTEKLKEYAASVGVATK